MKSTTQIDNNLHADPLSHREGSPSQPTSFFDNLQALDGVQFRTSLDDFYSSLPTYYVADTTTPVVYAAATDPVLSMGIPAGDLKVTDATLYNTYDLYNGSDAYYSPPYYMSPLSNTPHVQDCASPSPQYCNYNYGEYASPMYSTAQVLNVESRSSTYDQLHSNHIDARVSNNGTPFGDVMQYYQEPESSYASNYQRQTEQEQATVYTPSYYNQTPSFSPVDQPEYADLANSSISPSGSTTCLPPWPVQHAVPTSSSIDTPFPVSSPNFATPQFDLSSSSPPALNEPFAPSHDFQPVPTLDREPRLAVSPAPVVFALPARALTPQPQVKHGKESKIRTQTLLDECFGKIKKGRCKICGKGPRKYRDDRALEHLASKHAWQRVKNMTEFKKPKPGCLVRTRAQFAFAQNAIEEVRCRFCPEKTNLVLRQDIVDNHIDFYHSTLRKRVRKAEKDRVRVLMRGEEGFYNYYDQFLYNLYRV